MKNTLEAFFSDEVIIKDGSGKEEKMSRIHRIAELYTRNRFSFEVQGWGSQLLQQADITVNPWGVWGLANVEEALELIRYESFILGFQHAQPEFKNEQDEKKWFTIQVFDKIEVEVNKMKASKIKEMEEIKEKNPNVTADSERTQVESENEESLNVSEEIISRLRTMVDIVAEAGDKFADPTQLRLDDDTLQQLVDLGYAEEVEGKIMIKVESLEEQK